MIASGARLRSRGVLALLLVAASSAWSSARADEPLRLLIAGLESDGVPATTVTHVRDGLVEVAARYPVRVLPRRELAEIRFLLGCSDDKTLAVCLWRGRAALGADAVLLGRIRATVGRDQSATHALLQLSFVDLRRSEAELAAEQSGTKTGAGAADGVTELVEDARVAELAPTRIATRAEVWFARLVLPTLTADAAAKGQPAPVARAAPTTGPSPGSPSAMPSTSAKGTTVPGSAGPAPASGAAAAAVPPGATPPTDDDVPWDDKPGRRLLAGGVVALVLGVAAFGISVVTWSAANSAAPEAHGALAAVAAADPAYATANASLFANPSCAAPPTTGPAKDAVEIFRGKCESGESFASATRALLGTGAVLSAVGITGVVLGTLKARAGDGGKRPEAALRLRVAPGGLALSF